MKAQKLIFSFILAFSLLLISAVPAKAIYYTCVCTSSSTKIINAKNEGDCLAACQDYCGSEIGSMVGCKDDLAEANIKTEGNSNAGVKTLYDPLGGRTVNQLMGKVINAIFGVVGSLALLMFVWGGLTWMMAAGNQEKIKKGRDIIIWTVIGLAVIFFAYAIVRFVLTIL
jgi:hypothetical protein